MSREAFFFKHDLNARNDPKMVSLVRAGGWEAYGIAWALIEQLYEEGGRLAADPEVLAYNLRSERAKVEVVMRSDIFYIRRGYLGSESVDRRIQERRALADIGRESALRGWAARRGANWDPMATHATPNTRRGEEKRREESKAPPRSAAFTPPDLAAVKAYCDERRNGVDPGRWHDFYASKGWKIGRNPMKDWKAAVRTWERGEDALIAKAKLAPPPPPAPAWSCEWCKRGEPTVKPAKNAWGGKICEPCAEAQAKEEGGP